ncbi:hypothetical protein N0V93_003179 [Gnomoniopsis smithogilvyi]|uniref:Lipase 1 n=1 Tax=Gnomoniopsis smithogilvyi TaxID=1191159 RepID=A0A9W8YWM3_9PEZI|nr:hypothetical protein N0V93_003179 [Gnomoniopsis smithogilvyi]
MSVKFAGLLAAACFFMQGALAIATPRLGSLKRDDSTQAIPPSEDPWYTAPDGYESTSPGAILRNRTAPNSLIQAAGSNCSTAYQLLYRTTASQGNATFAVNTVLVPQDPTNALLSYQIPYDSAYINSSPSYTLSQQVYSDIKIALGKGYFVTVPDYEGPLASFTAGHMSGYATLDGVRATLNGAELYGLSDDTLYATWGYSGGALATEWAAELQADYASELSFAGSAMGGLTPNVTTVLETINLKISAGLAPPAIIGLLSQWPAAKEWLYSKLTTNTVGTYTAANFLAAENYTLSQAESSYEFQNIYKYFVDGLSDITDPTVSGVVDQDGVMGLHGVPLMPVYVYKTINDQISPIADTDALVASFCEQGANILYQRNTVGTHGTEEVYGDPAATLFLDAVLTGTYADAYTTTGCTVQNVTVESQGGTFGSGSGILSGL